jgi:hypothetical protein
MPTATVRSPEPHTWLRPQAVAFSGMPGGEHLAEDHLVHVVRGDAGPLQRGLDRHRAELVRRYAAEGAGERADRCARRPDNDDIFAGCHRAFSSFRRRDHEDWDRPARGLPFSG